MNRREHEERLAASHARGKAEDEPLHDWRLRQFKEIGEGMKSMKREVCGSHVIDTDYDELQPF